MQAAFSIFRTQSKKLNVRHREGARPLKWGRIALHLGGGLLAAALIAESAMPISWQVFTFSFAGILLALDFLRFSAPKFNVRLVKRLEWFAQEHEANRLTSATWFWLAMSVVALSGDRSAYLATLVTLSVGDPAGSIVGRKVRSPTLVHGRTVGGTLVFYCCELYGWCALPPPAGRGEHHPTESRRRWRLSAGGIARALHRKT